MKKNLIFILLMLNTLSLRAQNRSNIWMLGWNPPEFNFGIDFNQGFADTFTVNRPMRMLTTNTGICDTNGNLLFYTNGSWIANSLHDSLLNCHEFNPGTETTDETYGLGIPQGAVIIPKPEDVNQYYLFHESGEEVLTDSAIFYQPFELRYSLIDMNLDNQLGGIVAGQKTISILQDTLMYGRLAACKHANGRDWWLVAKKYQSNKYYKFLITPNGVEGPFVQFIGGQFGSFDQVGAAVFSPDGSKYMTCGPYNTFDLFDFDRCTGLFSNYQTGAISPDSITTLCCSFSPNSRFIYFNNVIEIFQFDTWAADLNASKIKVADWDTFYAPFATWFRNQQLAPDGKIYFTTYGSTNIMQYIDQPDSLGAACNVVQNEFVMPFINAYSPPTFPNYDLGNLAGSPCDTLYISSSNTLKDFNKLKLKILPNPNHGQFTLQYHLPQNMDGLIEIISINGKAEATFSRPAWSSSLNVDSNLSPGVYLVCMKSDDRMVTTKMIVN